MTAASTILPSSSFDRLAYWNGLEAGRRSADDLVFKFPLARCERLSTRDQDEVNRHVFSIIAKSWPGGFRGGNDEMRTPSQRQELLKALNETTRFSIDTRGNLDRLVGLEVELGQIFKRLGLMDGVVGWQFPIDIRVVHPQAPENYLARKDATDYLHCDPWRGEPADLINVVMYCEVNAHSSQLELYVVEPAELARFEAYRGDERESEYLLEGRPPVEFNHQPGQVILFDGYLPHRTRRLGDSVRISLNFSLRRLNPYAVIDDRWDRARQAWHKFWFVNDSNAMTFADRYHAELRRIASNESPAALEARRAALKKYFDVVA